MIRRNMKKAAAVTLGSLIVPVGIAVAGAAPASAGPDICVGGPYGYAYACVDTPGWPRPWHDNGWHGKGHWKHHH